MSREIITTNCIILSLDHQPIPFGRRFTVISDKYLIVVYDGNRNRNNKEMSENVFRRESNPGLLVTGQRPSVITTFE